MLLSRLTKRVLLTVQGILVGQEECFPFAYPYAELRPTSYQNIQSKSP
jgi:hypothetical protein